MNSVEEFLVKAGLFTMLFLLALLVRCGLYDRKRKISLVKPGSIFAPDGGEQNPFAKNYHEYVVLEVRDGHVLYQETKNLMKYTTDMDSFIYLYHLQQGVKA